MAAGDGSFTEVLDGSGIDRDEAGGKAWALDRLVEHHFPVPPAMVVRAAAYRRIATADPVAAVIRAARDGPAPHPGDVAEREGEIERAFLQAPLDAEVDAALRRALAAWLGHAPLAIRSSATAEDAAGYSFAGQYRSHLGITTLDEALAAVRRCWASLWFPAVCAYRRRMGLADIDLAMAVIVQQQVMSEWSGVMFTRDPQGDGTSLRIEAVRGMGEQLVSGRVTPSDFRLDRTTLLATGSGRRDRPPHLEDVGRLGLRIERRFGEPQDVEWAYAGGTIWVVQSRPITVGVPLTADDDGFDTDVPHGDTLTPQGVAEMLPGFLSPLVWSINQPLLEHAFRTLLDRSGAVLPALGRPFVARVGGRAMLDLSSLGEAVASLGHRGGIAAQYGEEASEETAAPASPRFGLGGVIRAWRDRRTIEDAVATLTTAVECLGLVEPDLSTVAATALLGYRRELRDLAARGMLAELAASTAATTAYASLEAALHRWLGEASRGIEAQRITSGHLGEVSIGPRRIAALAATIDAHATPMTRAVLAAGEADGARSRLLDAGPAGVVLAGAIETAARSFGCVSVYAGPDFVDRDREVWQLAVAAATRAPVPRPPPIAAAIDRAIGVVPRSWRVRRILTGQLVDVRRRILRRFAEDAVRFLALREEAKHALLVLGGFERRVIREMTGRLIRSGSLSHPDEVEVLTDGELEQMILGVESVGAAERSRRATAGLLAASRAPAVRRDLGAAHEGERLSGWAAGPGTVRGRARHVVSAADGGKLAPGEVLVAVTTDASWTPLFLTAGAIVLEQGGPLSHAAIVAREFGLPAVLNLPDALSRIPDGAMVEVDGTGGWVQILVGEGVTVG